MTAWWRGLSIRERIVVAGGVAVIGALASLQLFLSPVLSWRAEAALRAEAAHGDYRLVFRSAALGKPAKAAGVSQAPVRNVLTDLANRAGVPLVFVNALPDGSVEMQAGPAAPEAVFRLFAALESDHGVSVAVADIARAADEPSMVRLQATLRRAD